MAKILLSAADAISVPMQLGDISRTASPLSGKISDEPSLKNRAYRIFSGRKSASHYTVTEMWITLPKKGLCGVSKRVRSAAFLQNGTHRGSPEEIRSFSVEN